MRKTRRPIIESRTTPALDAMENAFFNLMLHMRTEIFQYKDYIGWLEKMRKWDEEKITKLKAEKKKIEANDKMLKEEIVQLKGIIKKMEAAE